MAKTVNPINANYVSLGVKGWTVIINHAGA